MNGSYELIVGKRLFQKYIYRPVFLIVFNIKYSNITQTVVNIKKKEKKKKKEDDLHFKVQNNFN